MRRGAFSTSSFPTTRHVVDQGTIDVGATETDGFSSCASRHDVLARITHENSLRNRRAKRDLLGL